MAPAGDQHPTWLWHLLLHPAVQRCMLNLDRYATILVPSLLTAPRYFAGKIEFGVIAQVPHCCITGACLRMRAESRACILRTCGAAIVALSPDEKW